MTDALYFYMPAKYKGEKVFILADIEDFEKISKHHWHVQKETGKLYAYTHLGNNKKISLHRFMMDNPKGMMVDHINHNTLDNRKSNLRIVTRTENQQNRKGAASHNPTGIRGVTITNHGTFRVRITVNKKPMYLGSYKTLEEATKVSKEAREKYFGKESSNV